MKPLLDPETRALWHFGWIRVLDILFILFILGIGVVTFFWWLFGKPTAIDLIASAVAVCFIFQVWIILLVFRCSRFVLDIIAEVKTMPEKAARLALAMSQQSGPSV